MQYRKLRAHCCPRIKNRFLMLERKFSSTSLPQDTSDGISPSPAIQRSDDIHTQASRNRGEPTKTRTTVKHRVIECDISQSGYRSSQKILKMQKCQHEGTHPHTLLKIQIRNVLLKWSQRKTVFTLTSRKTEIAKSARQPRLRGPLAGSALPLPYLKQKSSVTW